MDQEIHGNHIVFDTGEAIVKMGYSTFVLEEGILREHIWMCYSLKTPIQLKWRVSLFSTFHSSGSTF
jgi:hypothetical protein